MRRTLTLALLATLALAAPSEAAERTGRWLVLGDSAQGARAALASAVSASGARTAGKGVPRLGIATVRGPRAAISALGRAPGVARIVPEYRREFRRTPSDPGFGATETAPRTPSGTPLQWALRRMRFPEAWDTADGAGMLVGIIDSGIDAGHPELSGKIASSRVLGGTNAGSDEDGHGTHVSGLACAATDNGSGLAGAGFHCRIAFYKAPQLRDEDIVAAIVDASDRGAVAINMSFGGGDPSPAIDRAIEYALARDVVLVASAANEQVDDQGTPASQLQPNDGPDLDAGRGLVVTAADFSDRRPRTGRGRQISLAAYGFFDETDGPPGLVSTYTGLATAREILLCGCRTSFGGDSRYAYLQGTSMAAPQVTAAVALVAQANPLLSARDRMRVIKETAQRGGGGWTADRGWGILDAGAAVEAARRVDRTAPSSRARARRSQRLRRRGRTYIRVGVRGSDEPGAPRLVASGVRRYEIWLRRGRGRYRRAGTASARHRARRAALRRFR